MSSLLHELVFEVFEVFDIVWATNRLILFLPCRERTGQRYIV